MAMRRGCLLLGLVGVLGLGSASGCVSLDKYRRLDASLRNTKAEKEALAQELFDLRHGSGSLRQQIDLQQRELAAKDELINNLREETELLSQSRKVALQQLEDMRGRLGSVIISGPKLPPQLDSALKNFAQAHPGEVEYDAEQGIVKWKSDLLFALGSDVVKDSSMSALRGFADVLKSPAAADFEVVVVGHTDNRPIARAETRALHPSNWHLSTHRAIAVAKVLKESGYDPARIGLMGYGEYRPVADNTSEAGAQQNRRVDVYLVPRGSVGRVARAVDVDAGMAHSEQQPSPGK
ncbi:MAG: OmpA family protein [Phycisphaerae bacterium]|nr:OmpA family protein [Phycisphaerae bacterium]